MCPAIRDGPFPTGPTRRCNRDGRGRNSDEWLRVKRALLLLRRRLISSIPVLLIVIVGTFLLLEIAPGDAVDAYVLSLGGGDPSLLQSMRESYGLNQSMLARLWLYLTSL